MYTQEMLESIKKVEATRAERLANVKAGIHPRRMTAEEKVQVKMENHPRLYRVAICRARHWSQ